jgi:four helix bundle suffix protein
LKNVAPEVAANIMLCLGHQATFLLARQMERLERDFVEKGGFTERLYKARSDRRGGGGQVREASDQSGWSDKSDWSDF